MYKNLRWKLLATVVVIAWFLGYGMYPILAQRYSLPIPGWLAAKRLKLGLDLQGGVHLVLRVQTDDALRLETETSSERLREELRNQNLTVSGLTATTLTEFVVDGVPPDRDAEFRRIEQLNKLTVGSFTTENPVKFLARLAEVAPGELNRSLLYSGGSEAVEAAIRLAKSYTGKFEGLGFWGGFHGKTGGVLGLMGSTFKQGWGPLHPGLYLAPYAYCERCPFKLTYPACGLHCLEFARQIIKMHTTGSLAAILVEPVQGTAGNVVPPPEFLPGLLDIAREHGALLIADEMIPGFGRTGLMFGSSVRRRRRSRNCARGKASSPGSPRRSGS